MVMMEVDDCLECKVALLSNTHTSCRQIAFEDTSGQGYACFNNDISCGCEALVSEIKSRKYLQEIIIRLIDCLAEELWNSFIAMWMRLSEQKQQKVNNL